MKKTSILLTLICTFEFSSVCLGSTLLFEDFADSDVSYTLDDPEGQSGFDYWERNSSGAGYNDEPSPGIFRGMDLTANPPNIVDGEGTLRFENIDISGFTDIEFSGWFALESPKAALVDGDGLRITYSLDSGPEQNLLSILTNGGNTAYANDTNFDGVGDGTELTRSFAQIANGLSIPVTGDSLELIFRLRVPGLGRGMAFDDILVTAQTAVVPEPSVSVFVAAGLALLVARVRRLRGRSTVSE